MHQCFPHWRYNFILLCSMIILRRTTCRGFLHHAYFSFNHQLSSRRMLNLEFSEHPLQGFSSSTLASNRTLNTLSRRPFLKSTNVTSTFQKRPDSEKRKLSSFVRGSSEDSNDFFVPDKIEIPLDQVQLSFSRSSGAGGQNVNKVETKAELRFHVMSASWLPMEVRERIANNNANRINNEGYLSLSSQEYRTQHQNRKCVVSKLEEICLKAFPRPKVRKVKKGLSKRAKEQRKEDKRFRSKTKDSRRSVDF